MGRDGTAVQEYLRRAADLLGSIESDYTSGESPLARAAEEICSCVIRKGMIHVFGSGHSHLMAEEVFYRAGGLLDIDPILESGLMLHESALKSTRLERLSGYAHIIAEDREFCPRDVLVVVSNSGRNTVAVELAQEARSREMAVVAVTSLEHSSRVESRAPCGLRLFEAADIVIDNRVPYGDACVELEGPAQAMGPLSTLAGVAIVNSVMLRAAELLADRGEKPRVLISANIEDGGGGGCEDFPSRRGYRHL